MPLKNLDIPKSAPAAPLDQISDSASSPQINHNSRLAWCAFGLPSLFAGLVYYLTAAQGLTWRHGGEDGGDLATATTLLGVPHPTGYPLYILAGRVFLLLPFSSDPARLLTLASAFWGALAVGLVALAVFKFGRAILGENLASLGAGWLAGLALAFSPLFWSQALIVEIYSFNLALLACLLVALVHWWEKPGQARASLLALALGLPLAHHRTALFTLVGVAIFIWLVAHQNRWKIRRTATTWKSLILLAVIFLAAGLTPYLYLLERGNAVLPSSWGLVDFSGFWHYVSGSDYGYLLFAVPLEEVGKRLGASAALLLQQFGLPGLLLGLGGLLGAWKLPKARPLFGLVLVAILLNTGFAVTYYAANSQVYLLPAFTFWAVLEGLGFGWLVAKYSRSFLKRPALGLLIGLGLPLISLFSNYAALDLSHDQSAAVWAKTQLENAPAGVILLSNADSTTFALRYAQFVEGIRLDVVVADSRLLNQVWYRQNLARLYPDLNLSGSGADWGQILFAANPTRPFIILAPPTFPGVVCHE